MDEQQQPPAAPGEAPAEQQPGSRGVSDAPREDSAWDELVGLVVAGDVTRVELYRDESGFIVRAATPSATLASAGGPTLDAAVRAVARVHRDRQRR
jgi:hypothetical protein